MYEPKKTRRNTKNKPGYHTKHVCCGSITVNDLVNSAINDFEKETKLHELALETLYKERNGKSTQNIMCEMLI